MKIAVCLPSRGTVYSQTIEEILRELKAFGADWEIFWSHANPIPECFNIVTQKALDDPTVTHLWFVEEDMLLPEGILKHLMAELVENNWEAVASDYPLVQAPSATIYRDPYGAAYFTGCGCTLMKRKVFNYLKQPYWRSDIRWQLDIQPDYLVVTPEYVKPGQSVYGFQDIHFGISLYLKGHPIMVSSRSCGQRLMTHKGGKTKNEGQHVIKEYSEITAHKIFEVDNQPLVELYNVDDIDDRLHVSPEQADTLEVKGTYRRFKPGQLLINDKNKIWEKLL